MLAKESPNYGFLCLCEMRPRLPAERTECRPHSSLESVGLCIVELAQGWNPALTSFTPALHSLWAGLSHLPSLHAQPWPLEAL